MLKGPPQVPHMAYGQGNAGIPQNQGQQFNPNQGPQQWYQQQQQQQQPQQPQQGYYPQQMPNGMIMKFNEIIPKNRNSNSFFNCIDILAARIVT